MRQIYEYFNLKKDMKGKTGQGVCPAQIKLSRYFDLMSLLQSVY